MSLERVVSVCFCIVITSAIANGQQQSGTTGQPSRTSGAAVGEPMYSGGDVVPLRRVETRSESGGRTVVVEKLEGPDIEGRLTTFEEIVTETIPGPGNTQTRQDGFHQFTAVDRRRLSETTESRQDTQPNGVTSTVHSTWVPDLNGRLHLTSRVVEETRSSAAGLQQSDTTVLLPGLNEPLRETERTEATTQRINPA